MIACGWIWGACALAVVAIVKHRRFGCGRAWGYRRGCGGYGGYGGYGHGGDWHDGEHGGHEFAPPFARGGGGFRSFGVKAVLRRFFERLGTTPGQEKVVVAAAEELRATFQQAKDDLRGTRKDFADAFRRGPIDEAAVADIFVRHDTVISQTRRKVVEAVGRIHEALDDAQRAEVADLLEHGLGRGWHGRRRQQVT